MEYVDADGADCSSLWFCMQFCSLVAGDTRADHKVCSVMTKYEMINGALSYVRETFAAYLRLNGTKRYLNLAIMRPGLQTEYSATACSCSSSRVEF